MVEISSPVVAALLGAFAGSIGTFIVNWYFWRKRQNVNEKRFKKSLKLELESLQGWPDYKPYGGFPDVRPITAPSIIITQTS